MVTDSINMTKDVLAEKLYQTMQTEYDNYLAHILQMEPEGIIREAYGIITRADILILFEDDVWTNTLSKEQLVVACQLKNPLESLYLEWLDRDTNHMETLGESVRYSLESYARSLLAGHLPTSCKKTEKARNHHVKQEMQR